MTPRKTHGKGEDGLKNRDCTRRHRSCQTTTQCRWGGVAGTRPDQQDDPVERCRAYPSLLQSAPPCPLCSCNPCPLRDKEFLQDMPLDRWPRSAS